MIVLFATQYENLFATQKNTAFNRSSVVSSGLALLRAFCQYKIEYQVRKFFVKGLIRKNVAGRERDAGRLYESGYKPKRSQPTILGGAKYFDFKRATVFFS